jgi:hypothetical protein
VRRDDDTDGAEHDLAIRAPQPSSSLLSVRFLGYMQGNKPHFYRQSTRGVGQSARPTTAPELSVMR